VSQRAGSLPTLPTLSTGLGGPRPINFPYVDAATRAAEAARRIPSPPPIERKLKRKKVSWVEDQRLTSVRWFNKVGASHLPTLQGGLWMQQSDAVLHQITRPCLDKNWR
jgi:hypothetical protein